MTNWPPSTSSQRARFRQQFLRRLYLDAVGRLSDARGKWLISLMIPSQASELVDRSCLELPEYADFWANKWADLLRPILSRGDQGDDES